VIEPLRPDSLTFAFSAEKGLGPIVAAVVNYQKIYRIAFQQLGRTLSNGLVRRCWAWTLRESVCSRGDSWIDLPELGMGPGGTAHRKTAVQKPYAHSRCRSWQKRHIP
jgi:hypothetical protein